MTDKPKTPIWKRAAMRGVIVAVAMVALVELLRASGREVSADRGQEIFIAVAGGAVWATFYALMASGVDKMMKKMEMAAKEEGEP
ncbi:MAG: hypothetical protein R3C51_01710 [Parvularculaceae bacterium]